MMREVYKPAAAKSFFEKIVPRTALAAIWAANLNGGFSIYAGNICPDKEWPALNV
jgi:hypothetical protein